MQKDVIYIDVDDDITTVIGKVKVAKHKIVALVPPKRVGMLQSAVNLRLLNRAAEQKGKKLVLISNNTQLSTLAGMTGIPVAKTLQSKPELAQIDALDIDDGDEVIDGSELPIGEHARQAAGASDGSEMASVAAVGTTALAAANETVPVATPSSTKKPRAKNGKVPNFDKFRKRLILIIIGSILLIGFLVWAVFFAPHANVVVTMRTTDAAVSQQVTLSPTAATSAKNSILKSDTKLLKKDVSTPITPTGKKDIGEKASGTVKFTNNRLVAVKVSAGEIVTAGGFNFAVASDVSVPAASLGSCSGRACVAEGTANATINAVKSGSKYNGVSGAVEGANVSGQLASATTGGTDKTVPVTTREDIEKAEAAAADSVDKTAAQAELEKQFAKAFIVVKDSLQVDTSAVKPNVSADAEVPADGAKVSGSVVYTLYGVELSELKTYLKAILEQQLEDSSNQRVYSTGAEETTFTGIDKSDAGLTVNLSTNASTGPNITEEAIKKLASGKRYGEVKSAVESINGVESAEVEFSTFWVRKVPANDEKITVEFKVNGTQ